MGQMGSHSAMAIVAPLTTVGRLNPFFGGGLFLFLFLFDHSPTTSAQWAASTTLHKTKMMGHGSPN